MLHRHASPAVAGSFLAGALCGATVSSLGLALAAGLLSPVPGSTRAFVATAVVVVLILRQVKVFSIPLPQRCHQIPQEVFVGPPKRGAFRFGAELGTGVRTYVTTSAPYGLAAVLVLTPGDSPSRSLLGAALAAVGYGVGRSIVIVSQVLAKRIVVEPPGVWLGTTAVVSLGSALGVATRLLGG